MLFRNEVTVSEEKNEDRIATDWNRTVDSTGTRSTNFRKAGGQITISV